MKRLIQSLKTGKLELLETPVPAVKPGHILIQSYCSIISKGTEESLLEFGKSSWLKKAQLQPDKLIQLKDKIKTEGIREALAAVNAKLDTPITPGYSQSGRVIEVGQGVTQFSVGDRVVSNGHHAEYVCVPTNLCIKIPSQSTITFEEAAMTPIASIALQSIRLLNPTLGECIAVQGLGLIGLIAVQLLKAQGCRVLGIDFDGPQLDLAKQFGAEVHSLSQDPDPTRHALSFSNGHGVDGVIMAATTQSSEPLHQAAQMSRKRGRIILVGVVGTKLNRSDFYAKELSFQVSCSYGPGRYDSQYEQKGLDYPIGFVRWTEQRNMEAILGLMAERKLNVNPLITHRFPFSEAISAYSLLDNNSNSRAILFSYPVGCANLASKRKLHLQVLSSLNENIQLGIIGAGAHVTKILLPAIKKLNSSIVGICSESGLSASTAARKHNIPQVFETSTELLNSPDINSVLIASRHNSHAELVIEAIKQRKNIFVEKPLAMNLSELNQIETTLESSHFSKVLWVGYNRRYSSLSQKLFSLFSSSSSPKQMVYTVNALALPESHWIHDPSTGGGRVLSEMGHFIDLLCFFANSPMTDHQVSRMTSESSQLNNNLTINLKFANGSMGSIHYSTLGNRSYPKEKIEVFSDGKVATIDNFRTLIAFGFKGFKKMALWSQDKGHTQCLDSFFKAIKGSNTSQDRLREVFEISRLVCLISNNETIHSNHSSEVA